MKTVFKLVIWLSAFVGWLGLAALPAYADTWETLTSGVTNDLNAVRFVNDTTGFAVGGAPFIGGAGVLLKTTNAGDSWNSLAIPLPSGQTSRPPLHSIHCSSVLTCTAVGDNAYILKTSNGGSSWSLETAGTLAATPWFWDVFMTSDSSAVAVGNAGVIYRTINGGSTWSSIRSGTTENLLGVYFANATTGWAVGTSGLTLKTTDGGATWTRQTSGNAAGSYEIFSLDTLTAWMSDGPGRVRKTTDGGATWTSTSYDATLGTLRGIYFKDSSVGYGASGYGTVKKSVDGGATWTTETTAPGGVILRGVSCAGNRCFVVGDDGVILRGAASTAAGSETSSGTGSAVTSGSTGTTGSSSSDSTGSSGTSGTSSGTAGSATSPAPDTTAPATPTDLRLTSDLTNLFPSFAWSASTDNVSVAGYDVRLYNITDNRDVFAFTANGTALAYTVPASVVLTVGIRYQFEVRARDASGNVGRATPVNFVLISASATAGDTAAPSAPGEVRITSDLTNLFPSFSWGAATDNVGVTGYEVRVFNVSTSRDIFPFSANGGSLSYTVPASVSLTVGQRYQFSVRALDAAGNAGRATAREFTLQTPPPDTTAPATPTDLRLTSDLTNLFPSFAWGAATDNVGVTGYDVRLFNVTTNRDVFPFTANGLSLSYTVPAGVSLVVGQTYQFEVRARDASGNVGRAAPVDFVLAAAPSAEESSAPAETSESSETSASESLPDLFIDSANLTASRLTFTVGNRGLRTTGGFRARFEWLNHRGFWMSSPAPRTIAFPDMAGGGGGTATRQWNTTNSLLAPLRAFITRAPRGAATLRITLDPDDRLSEGDEENNVFDVARPVLAFRRR